jgi:hypothetical protein
LSYSNPSATPNFTGGDPLAPNGGSFCQTEAGTQVGAWQGTIPSGWIKSFSVVEGLPALTRTTISGTGVTQGAAPGQYRLSLSLAAQGGATFPLNGGTTDAKNNTTAAVSPNIVNYNWKSNSSNVISVDSNGVLTLKRVGYATIECSQARAVNAAAPSAPLSTDFAYAYVDITVTR